jgi:hypothetical protein
MFIFTKKIVFEEQNLVKEKKEYFQNIWNFFIFDIEWGVFSLKFLM